MCDQATNTKKAASSQQAKAPEVKSSTLPANALCDTSSETSRSGSSLSSHGSSESSGDSLSTCSATHDLTLADLCRDAKESFSEDSWKAAETARPSKSQEMMTMAEKVLLFEMAVIRARGAVRYFCKVFMKQMESSGYSLWRTLAAIDPSAKFSKKEHTAYALEANINKVMWISRNSRNTCPLPQISVLEEVVAVPLPHYHCAQFPAISRTFFRFPKSGGISIQGD